MSAPSSMKTIYVKTIGTCNLNCSHCFTNGSSGDKTAFNIDATLKWLADYIQGDGTNYHIELHGGEPFLVKLVHLRRFTSTLRSRYPEISIGATSNLTYPVTEDHIKFFKEELDSQLGTSWDPFIRWTTDKQYELWQHNLRLLISNDIRPRVNVSMSYRLLNEYSPKLFLSTMEDIGVTHVELERITLDGNAAKAPGIFPDNDHQDLWFLELLKHYQSCDSPVIVETIDNLLLRLSQNVVHAGTNCRNCEQNLVTINPNGTLSTCPNVAESIQYAHIQEHPSVFLEHDMRATTQAKESDIPLGCLTCDVFDLCGGDCHQLPYDGRCGGYKRTLHYISGRPYKEPTPDPNIIHKEV